MQMQFYLNFIGPSSQHEIFQSLLVFKSDFVPNITYGHAS